MNILNAIPEKIMGNQELKIDSKCREVSDEVAYMHQSDTAGV